MTCQESWSAEFICGRNFLLCGSKNSLTSRWVEYEIKTTLEKEWALRREKGTLVQKLIPLNLDGYMFSDEWGLGLLANEIRSRVAANFQGWETIKQNLDIQVDRVIEALRADERARGEAAAVENLVLNQDLDLLEKDSANCVFQTL
jgi:hypothetical protein